MAHPERKGGYRGFLPPESERAKKKKKRKGLSDSAATTLNITSGPRTRPTHKPYLNMEIANP